MKRRYNKKIEVRLKKLIEYGRKKDVDEII